jgi:putative membrane protein
MGAAMIRRILAKILIGALALWAADYLLTGFSVTGGITGYLVAGAVLGLLNTLVRPVLKLITFPLILVTFGLFTIIINAAMLLLAAHLTGLIVISGISALLWAMSITSLVHIVLDPQ